MEPTGFLTTFGICLFFGACLSVWEWVEKKDAKQAGKLFASIFAFSLFLISLLHLLFLLFPSLTARP